MKLNKIKKLCKDSSRVELYTRRDGRQFIGDGTGIWPVDEQLFLNEGTIRTIFDVPYVKWEGDWHFNEFNYGLDKDAEISGVTESLLDDVWETDSETILGPVGTRAFTEWGEMQLLEAPGGTRHLWVPTAQFAPCPDTVSRFALRETPGGSRALAVYAGMLVGGLILVPPLSAQAQIQAMLRELGEKEVM